VNVLCTSFPLDLRRIARSRAARMLVCALALLLAVTNVMAAAMPLSEHGTHGGKDAQAAVSQSHAHCSDHGAPASPASHDSHHGHGADCPCCGKACACMHACDGLVLAMPPALSMPSTRIFAIAPPRDGAAIETPLLRPPIA
jgi:ABC-type nickel/cobalt efflux system permease component RcnA